MEFKFRQLLRARAAATPAGGGRHAQRARRRRPGPSVLAAAPGRQSELSLTGGGRPDASGHQTKRPRIRPARAKWPGQQRRARREIISAR